MKPVRLTQALLFAASTALRAAVPPVVKWHPGHYAYVGGGLETTLPPKSFLP